MYYIYILQSQKDKRTYVGYTKDFEERFKKHSSGQVRSTKYRRPFKLLLLEKFEDMSKAKRRELWWKSGRGRVELSKFF
ncbi:GIY-YIG nuclease family protein [Candidatus Parcubacteria bacterium]|nr:GIY-YIG nuclease family protein [Candidatus Parcubacteria bacterium]